MNQIPFIVIFLKYGIGTSKSLQGLSEISAGFGVNLCRCWRDQNLVYMLLILEAVLRSTTVKALFYGPLTHGGVGGAPRQHGDAPPEPAQLVDLLPLSQSVAAHQGRPRVELSEPVAPEHFDALQFEAPRWTWENNRN